MRRSAASAGEDGQSDLRDLHRIKSSDTKENERTLTVSYVYPGSRGTCSCPFRVLRKGVIIVSTYEEFMVLLTMGIFIVAILSLENKK